MASRSDVLSVSFRCASTAENTSVEAVDLFDPPALGARHHPLNQHLETRDVDLHVHH